MTDIQSTAHEFVTLYYKAFDEDRASLRNLYRQNSLLTFETTQTCGVDRIMEQLTNLPFKEVKHRISTLDAQPVAGSILVLVTGALGIDGGEKEQKFVSSLHLVEDGGSWFVANEISRLRFE